MTKLKENKYGKLESNTLFQSYFVRDELSLKQSVVFKVCLYLEVSRAVFFTSKTQIKLWSMTNEVY